jgi:Tfp pilus assembly protein PilX
MQHMLWPIHTPRGSVLIIALFTMALLTLLGAAATSTSRTDITISGNVKAIQESFYATEVGLTEGELFVKNMKTPDLDPDIKGLYVDGKQVLSAMSWDTTDSIEVQASVLPQAMDTAHDPPRFTIEENPGLTQKDKDSLKTKSKTGPNFYNITSQGTGSNKRTKTILRTIYATRFN